MNLKNSIISDLGTYQDEYALLRASLSLPIFVVDVLVVDLDERHDD